MNINEAKSQWLKAKIVGELSPVTVKNYSSTINTLTKFLESRKIVEIEKIDNNAFIDFLNTYDNARTKAIVGTIIKVFLRYFNIEITAQQPEYKLSKVKAANKELIDNILSSNSTHSNFDKAIISLMLSSGLRATEITKLKIKHLNFDKLIGVVISKGMKEDETPDTFIFSNEAKEYIITYLGNRITHLNDYVFLNEGHQWKYKDLWAYFVKNFKFKPHQIRHSFCVNNSRTLSPVEQKIVARHRDFKTTLRYIEPDKETVIESAQKKLDDKTKEQEAKKS